MCITVDARKILLCFSGSAKSCFLVPKNTLFFVSLMRRVNLFPWVYKEEIPILNDRNKEVSHGVLTLRPTSKIVNLSLNAVAIQAQHPTDKTCLVVMVKAWSACGSKRSPAQATKPLLCVCYAIP